MGSLCVAPARGTAESTTGAMRILFLCTAHNSLSQRLFLVLARKHSVTIEYALSESTMIEAAELAKPHLVLCPFLTTRVPREVHDKYLMLIVHPGPPGDACSSALDWLLMGDDGTEPDCVKLLRDDAFSPIGRSHWGVTVLQAIGELDAGPVWAFDQFPVDINESGLTKSSLYRGPVTQAALLAAALGQPLSPPSTRGSSRASRTPSCARRRRSPSAAGPSTAGRCSRPASATGTWRGTARPATRAASPKSTSRPTTAR